MMQGKPRWVPWKAAGKYLERAGARVGIRTKIGPLIRQSLLPLGRIRENRHAMQALHGRIVELYERIATGRLEAGDVIPANKVVPYERCMHIREMYATGGISGTDLSGETADVLVFKHFQDPSAGTILDVGANFGYTAVAIRRSGTPCPILSIEALEWHRSCLEEVKRLDPIGCDFHIGAVSDRSQELIFYVPVIDGVPHDGFNSAAGAANFTTHHRDWLISNSLRYVLPSKAHTFVLAQNRIAAEPLDQLLRRRYTVPTSPIVALKIDVEGHEPEVLAGAVGIFERDHPFVMIEGGMRNPAVAEFFAARGYVYADRTGDQVTLNPDYSAAINGYWLHGEKLEQYRAMGLLRY